MEFFFYVELLNWCNFQLLFSFSVFSNFSNKKNEKIFGFSEFSSLRIEKSSHSKRYRKIINGIRKWRKKESNNNNKKKIRKKRNNSTDFCFRFSGSFCKIRNSRNLEWWMDQNKKHLKWVCTFRWLRYSYFWKTEIVKSINAGFILMAPTTPLNTVSDGFGLFLHCFFY